MEASMKRKRNKVSASIYPLAWSLILVLSAYILLRFAVLSFSNDIGQVDNVKNAILSKLYSYMMEAGSSFVRYQENDNDDTLEFPLLSDGYLSGKYSTDNTLNPNYELVGTPNIKKREHENATNTDESKDDSNVSRVNYQDITKGKLTKEYILTNGAMGYGSGGNDFIVAVEEDDSKTHSLSVGYVDGDIDKIAVTTVEGQGSAIETSVGGKALPTMKQLKDVTYLVNNFYIVDSTTKITDELFNAEKLLKRDMIIKQGNDQPQVLIYHTHSQEMYADSKGKDQSIVAVGEHLDEILREDYGYNVIHDTTQYDNVDRNNAYDQAEDGLKKILDENPSIEVIIDLHRDDGRPRIVYIDGKETAQLMLFQGLSMNQKGPINYLHNPNLEGNLAFGLQLRMKSLEMFPNFFYKNYLKCYRYNLHFREKSILVEVGTDENSFESAVNAMEPLAKVIDRVLQGK